MKIAAFVALFAFAASVQAAPVPSSKGGLIKRKILALYNSNGNSDYRQSNIHNYAETVLGHLGYIPVPFDVAQGPPDSIAADVGAIVSWFEGTSMPAPDRYLAFLHRCLNHNVRVVMLDNPGFFADSRTGVKTARADVNRLFARLGLRYEGDYEDNPLFIDIVKYDTQMIGFERPLERRALEYERLVSTGKANAVFLSLALAQKQGSRSDVVVVTPQGGVVFGSHILYRQPYDDADNAAQVVRWVLNPFRFFKQALQPTVSPVMDIAVRQGRRMLMSHIDGDGFFNISQVDRKSFSGKIIADSVLTALPLPVSISFIVSEIDPAVQKDARKISAARAVAKLANTEVASHTYSHPFVWSEAQKKNFQGQYDVYALQVPGYQFSLEKEIIGSLALLNDFLTPLNKKSSLLFWSGNCLPEADALGLANARGLLAINGGQTRFDGRYASYAAVSPIGRPEGPYFQIHAPSSNENMYTNLWQGPFNGYENVIETFRNTGKGRILRPIDIYYHFYSGERLAGLAAVRKVYAWALAQKTHPVFTSLYVGIAQGFYSARLQQRGENDFEVRDAGDCRTVRFDDTPLWPDLVVSTNVTGFSRLNGSLYVFLGEAPSARIQLTASRPSRPCLANASMEVTAFTVTKRGGSFFFTPYSAPAFDLWAGPSGRTVRLQVTGGITQTLTTRTDADGKAAFTCNAFTPGQPCRAEWTIE
ncbi:MAG: hypothetical protein V1913_02250 [Fibrobacterota bacterium]